MIVSSVNLQFSFCSRLLFRRLTECCNCKVVCGGISSLLDPGEANQVKQMIFSCGSDSNMHFTYLYVS